MIVLYGFGPMFGLPDPSGFVIKTEVQLKMADLDYRMQTGGLPRAPKGKLPFIEDKGRTIADSTFIRDYIEKTYGVDLDRGLTPDMRARCWAIERMLEDHLYWSIVHLRWADDANFAKGPAHFFDGFPREARESIRQEGRARMMAALHGHGLGRHAQADAEELGMRTVKALSGLLGNKPYLMGPEPSGVDATAFAMVASLLTPFFESRLRDYAQSHSNLVAYSERMMKEYYPKYVKLAA